MECLNRAVSGSFLGINLKLRANSASTIVGVGLEPALSSIRDQSSRLHNEPAGNLSSTAITQDAANWPKRSILVHPDPKPRWNPPRLVDKRMGTADRSGLIFRGFKTFTMRQYSKGVLLRSWEPYTRRLWQRNYYEHIIRNERERNAIRDYIRANPQRWGKNRGGVEQHNDPNS